MYMVRSTAGRPRRWDSNQSSIGGVEAVDPCRNGNRRGSPRDDRSCGRGAVPIATAASGCDVPAPRPAGSDFRRITGAAEPGQVPADGRAVVVVGAVVAKPAGSGAEVLPGAGLLDRGPHRQGLLTETADRLVGWDRRDRERFAEVQELDPRRSPAEHLFAEEGIEVHPTEARLLVGDRRGSARSCSR